MKIVKCIAHTLTIIGGLNWGLVGLFNLDLVAKIFGEMTTISKAVYILIGISAVISICAVKDVCASCCSNDKAPEAPAAPSTPPTPAI